MHDNPEHARRAVVVHLPDPPQEPASGHEQSTLLDYAQRLADLRGDVSAGVYQPSRSYQAPPYFVPSHTLTRQEAAALGIAGPGDLFGGVVPCDYMATKAISHPLVSPDAAAPADWSAMLADQLGDAVLIGRVAFDPDDARRAGLQLLERGPVRIKPVRSSAGRGQVVARDAAELQALLHGLDPAEIKRHGLVLEEHLEEVRTFSVGQVQVADFTATYFGHQRLTRDNQGHDVYGGSDLTVVQGGFDELMALRPAAEVRRAIQQARQYDAAVRTCFTGFFCSRSNYDIALGRDASGQWRSGVLEQSWRAGGATGPELAALEVFRRHPERSSVRTAGFEVFGYSAAPPPHAHVHFRGVDPRLGPLTKYTLVVDP